VVARRPQSKDLRLLQRTNKSQSILFLKPNRCIYIYLDMTRPFTPALPCMCASFRRASRALTQFYDQAMRPLGLRGTQFTVLQALSLAGEVSQGQLGQILAIDSTTLTRTLEIMRRRGWIAKRPGEDRREWRLRLTRSGESQFKRALPSWEEVQSRLRSRLGSDRWEKLLSLTNIVTSAVTESGDLS
jgi:DNA-binding MarR family transcriptional regulator